MLFIVRGKSISGLNKKHGDEAQELFTFAVQIPQRAFSAKHFNSFHKAHVYLIFFLAAPLIVVVHLRRTIQLNLNDSLSRVMSVEKCGRIINFHTARASNINLASPTRTPVLFVFFYSIPCWLLLLFVP